MIFEPLANTGRLSTAHRGLSRTVDIYNYEGHIRCRRFYKLIAADGANRATLDTEHRLEADRPG
jgi:hypothetical protein